MTERTYSEEDIAKVMEFYNIHKHNKTYREMAYEYGICPSKFYYIVKKGLKKTQTKKRDFVLAYIAENKRKYDRCSIKATSFILRVSRKQIEKWLFDAGYEASIAGGFIFSTSYINKIVKMYESGIPVDEIAGTTPMGLHDIPAMQKLIDNNIPVIKEEASRKKVYTQEEIQGCIDLVDSGTSVKETAIEKGIPESTIRGWIKKDSKTNRAFNNELKILKKQAQLMDFISDGFNALSIRGALSKNDTTPRTTAGVPDSQIKEWFKQEKDESKIIEVPKEYMDGFVNEDNVNLTDILKEDVVHITPLKTKNEWSKLKSVNEVFVPFKKEGGDLISVLGECVEHKTGDTIKTQPTLQIKLGEIEHKIAELTGEIKKLEGYRDTLKQAILILNAGL